MDQGPLPQDSHPRCNIVLSDCLNEHFSISSSHLDLGPTTGETSLHILELLLPLCLLVLSLFKRRDILGLEPGGHALDCVLVDLGWILERAVLDNRGRDVGRISIYIELLAFETTGFRMEHL